MRLIHKLISWLFPDVSPTCELGLRGRHVRAGARGGIREGRRERGGGGAAGEGERKEGMSEGREEDGREG